MFSLLRKTLFLVFWTTFSVFLFLIGATTVDAANCSTGICISQSISKSPIYQGDSYIVRATITNNSSNAYSGTVTMYWDYVPNPQKGFCGVSYTVPAEGSVTVPTDSPPCGSTSDMPGRTIYFQANTTANGTTIWNTTQYTVETPPKLSSGLSWSDMASTTYGTALGYAQTSKATAKIPGTFIFDPIVGTVLNAGNEQTLKVTFTPADAYKDTYKEEKTEAYLTVSKKALTVTADNKSKKQGEANPTLTATYSGFENGDTSAVLNTAPTLSTTAVLNSAVGTYPITVSGGSDNNYSFSTYVNGTLTVNPSSFNISAGANTSFCSGCSATAAPGASISVTAATPSSGFQFSSWSWTGSNNPCSSAGSDKCDFTATESGIISVVFSRITASIISFTATPATINYNTASTLAWTSANTTSSCTLNGVTVGQNNTGLSTGNLTAASNVYNLVCNGVADSLNGGLTRSVTVTVTQPLPASFSLSNFTVCDADTNGNCRDYIYGNGRAYYKVRITNSGELSGTFNGYFQIGSSNTLAISQVVPAGRYVDYSLGNDSGTGTYSFIACKDASNCTAPITRTFMAPPSLLASPSTVGSGSATSISATADTNYTVTYSDQGCGVGGTINLTFLWSTTKSFTCTYTNTTGSAFTRSPTITVTQMLASRVLSSDVTVNPVVQSATLNVTLPTNGTITGTGINCPDDCQQPFPATTVVTLTGTPASNYSFGSWTGCDADGTSGNVCTATMGTAGTSKTVSANFVPTVVTATLTARNAAGTVVTTASTGETITFTAEVAGTATGDVAYSNQSCGTGVTVREASATSNSFLCTFPTSNNWPISATVQQQGLTVNTEPKTINITAPPNTLFIRTFANERESNPGQTITFNDSSQNSGNFVTPHTIQKTPLIDIAFSAPSSYLGNIFLGWSGCDSVGSQRRCFVRVGNGGTKTVIANYGSSDFQPKLTVGTGSIQVDGSRYKEPKSDVYVHNGENGYPDNVYVAATFTNLSGAKYDAEDVAIFFEQSVDNGLNYALATINTGGDSIPSIPVGTSAKGWGGISLAPNSYLIRACAQPTNAVEKTCTTGVRVVVENPPPPPPSPCKVTFTNSSTYPAGDIQTHVDITKDGCASDRWVEQFASEGATISNSANQVLDYVLGGWRPFGWSDKVGNDGDVHTTSFQYYANQANSGSGFFKGSGIGIWGPPWEEWGVPFTDIPSYSYNLKNEDGGYSIKMQGAKTYRGLYGYKIASHFQARFRCYTEYHKVYDPTTNTFVTDNEWSYIYPPISGYLEVNPYVNSCYSRNVAGDYYEASCGDSETPAFSQPADCPGGLGPKLEGITTNPLPTPAAIIRRHTLNVNSKLGSSFEPNVSTTQIGNAVALDKNGVPVSPTVIVLPLEGGNFGGNTNYVRTTERNYEVILEAPQERTSPTGIFTGWTGDCTAVAGNSRQCAVSFVYGLSGGVTKTVTANYTNTLTAPIVLANTPGCDVGVGKIQVWGRAAIANATGYKLYRSTDPDFTPSSSNLVKDFTSASPFPFSDTATPPTNAYIDGATTSIAPGAYYYKLQAYNISVGSPNSAASSLTAASLQCPDLVVDSVTGVEIINSSTGAVIIDTTKVPSNTSIKFRAKIRNQGGAVPTSLEFNNQFQLDSNTNFPYTSDDSLFGLGSGLNGLSPFVTSEAIPTVSLGGHSLQVCADIPPVKPGTVRDESNEDNNCLASTFSFSVVTPITVQLECENQGGTFKNDYCVIDYAQASNLRWTVSGAPTSCSWVASDVTGDAAKQSYTVTGNPFSLNNLLNKLNFKYQLECR